MQHDEEFKVTDTVIEIPAIIVGGMIRMCSYDMIKLNSEMLQKIASTMNGEVVYIKFDGVLSRNSLLCTGHNCYRVISKEKREAGIFKCEDCNGRSPKKLFGR